MGSLESNCSCTTSPWHPPSPAHQIHRPRAMRMPSWAPDDFPNARSHISNFPPLLISPFSPACFFLSTPGFFLSARFLSLPVNPCALAPPNPNLVSIECTTHLLPSAPILTSIASHRHTSRLARPKNSVNRCASLRAFHLTHVLPRR